MVLEVKKEHSDKDFIPIKKRAIGIDGIRGVVAIIIALFHFELIFPFGNYAVFSTGYLGVEFFFVLSGFLLVKEFSEDPNSGKNDIGIVIKKKLIRLYPAYLVALFSLGFIYSAKWFNGNFKEWLQSEQHFKGFIVELFCLQATGISKFQYINGPSWYVSALIISTIILMPLLKYGKVVFINRISPFISLLFYLIFFFKDPYMSPNNFWMGFISTALTRSLAGMLLGIFLYSIYSRIKPWIQNLGYMKISILESVSTIFFFKLLIFRQASRWNFLVFIPICTLILLMFSSEGIITKILSNKLFQFFGKISFSFYILQSICSNYINCWFSGLSNPYITFFYLIINLITAILLYYFVEANFPRLMKRL